MVLSDEQLAEIEQRANAATAGDWTIRGGSWVDGGLRLAGYGIRFADGAFDARYEGWDARTNFPPDTLEGEQASKDRAFLAHAREDIPALCATVKHLRAENSDMRKAVDHWASLHARISADNTSLINQLADFSTQGEQMNELCMERVWDNGDMTDCGLESEIGLFDERGRPACSKHGKPPKPTLREAEIALRAQGIDPKDIVNNFIEQLLRDRSDLQSQLEQLRAGHQESEKQLREWQDKVVSLMDRLAQVEQEREALQGEVTFLNDKYLEREAAVIESVRSRAIQLCKDKAAKYKALADDSLPNDQTAARTAAMAAALNAIAAEIEKL